MNVHVIYLYKQIQSKMALVYGPQYLKRYSHVIWDKKFMFDIRVDY